MVMWMLLTQTASAYDTIGAVWPTSSMPISYTVQAELGGSVEDSAALEAIQAGFAVWAEVDCAGITFDYRGRSDAVWGQVDGQNTVFIMDSGWPEEASMLSTPMIITNGAEIVEVDIALNAQHFAWDIDNPDGVAWYDIQSAITHEVGHLLGLWHSSVTGASLNPMMAGHPEAKTLEEDDVEGLCSIYSGAAAASAEVGEACIEHDDCADGLCLADGGDRYCSQTCEVDADCPEDWECLEADGQQVCARPVDGSGACATQSLRRGGSGWLPLIPLVLLGWGMRRTLRMS